MSPPVTCAPSSRPARWLATACAVLALSPWSVLCSQGSPVVGQRASRSDIATRVADLERTLQSQKLDKNRRKQDSTELSTLRLRLTDGDFKIGDRFVYTLVHDSVQTDTAFVRDGMMVSITNLPEVSVKGVLRSELTDRLTAHISRYLKNASIRTVLTTRISIMGAVRSPGFYMASPDRPISELLMLAGGPAPEANLSELEIVRGSATILNAKESRKAIKEGRTLEQADVQSGDEVRIPQKRKINWQSFIQLLFVISSLFFALVSFLQWYWNRQQ